MKPEISKDRIRDIMITILLIIIYVLFYYFVTASDTVNDGKSQQMQSPPSELQKNASLATSETVNDGKSQQIQSPSSELQKNASLATSETIELPTPVPDVTLTPIIVEPKIHSIKMDVSHGFSPKVITINKSDIIIWYDNEDQRTRIILLSRDGLFENKTMQYLDRYNYQFNQQGNYTFNLAEYSTNKEYDNAIGNVIVN
jgi:predicted ATP-grasp superfamily ATP-dependent carboligase